MQPSLLNAAPATRALVLQSLREGGSLLGPPFGRPYLSMAAAGFQLLHFKQFKHSSSRVAKLGIPFFQQE